MRAIRGWLWGEVFGDVAGRLAELMTPFFARTGINQFDAPGILPYEIIGRWRTAGHLANRTVRMR